jgi:hypothetical protein
VTNRERQFGGAQQPVRTPADRRRRVAIGVLVVAILASLSSGSVPDSARTVFYACAGLTALAATVYLAVTTRSGVFAAWALYLVIIVGGQIARDAFDLERTGLWVVIGASVASGILAMALVVRNVRRNRELERFISLEATSLAFFTTMIFLLTYALFESWADVKDLSMWVPWLIGMFSWGIYSILLGRRYS